MLFSKPGLKAWPSKWLTATNGLLENVAIDLPMFSPTVKHTIKPGPAVAAIPSISFKETLLSSKAALIIYSISVSYTHLTLPTNREV